MLFPYVKESRGATEITNEGKCVDLKNDIRSLETCQDESTFVKVSELFMEKWKTAEEICITDILTYFFNSFYYAVTNHFIN